MDTKGLMPRVSAKPKMEMPKKKEDSFDIIKFLNCSLSSSFILSNEVHRKHWNIESTAFLSYHSYLDELYGDLNGDVDKFAEYIRIQGKFPAATLKEYAMHSKVEECGFKETNTDSAIFKSLIKNYEIMQGHFKMHFEHLEKYPGIQDYVAGVIDGYGKKLWFMKSIAKNL